VAKGWTQTDLARHLDVPLNTVWRWERESMTPTEHHRCALQEALRAETREEWVKRLKGRKGLDMEVATKIRERWEVFERALKPVYETVEALAMAVGLRVGRTERTITSGFERHPSYPPDAALPRVVTELTILDETTSRTLTFQPVGLNYIGTWGKLVVRQVNPIRAVTIEKDGFFLRPPDGDVSREPRRDDETSDLGRWVTLTPTTLKAMQVGERYLQALVESTFFGGGAVITTG
jgi:transcriptional regulator with XRE-family HTH domain